VIASSRRRKAGGACSGRLFGRWCAIRGCISRLGRAPVRDAWFGTCGRPELTGCQPISVRRVHRPLRRSVGESAGEVPLDAAAQPRATIPTRCSPEPFGWATQAIRFGPGSAIGDGRSHV